MKILVLASALPYPPRGGGPTRNYHILRQLAARHRVTLLAYSAGADARQAAPLEALGMEVHTVPRRQGSKRAEQLASLLSPASFQKRSFHRPEMQAAITRLLASGDYDVVQVEFSHMSYFNFRSRAILVLDEHNLDYEVLQRMSRTERGPFRRLYNGLEYLKVRREEQRAWRRVDACVLTSPREEAVVRRRVPGLPTTVVANGVDLEYFHAPTLPSPASAGGKDIVFTGSIDYRPNTDAVIYFAREILPLILARRPDATFTVVGMRPPPEVLRLAGRGVTITGAVPDVRPYLAEAAVVVAPLRMGSGTRLKLLEAMSMGKPIVSTALGCEGLGVADGEPLLVADQPAAFAEKVLGLMGDRELAAGLGRRGRALVEQEYGWPSVVRRLEAFYGRLRATRADGCAARARTASAYRQSP